MQPLVILLDDLHAADAASLVLLRFVSELVGQAPVVLVGSYRERGCERTTFGAVRGARALRSAAGRRAPELGDVEAYVHGVTGRETSRSAAARSC